MTIEAADGPVKISSKPTVILSLSPTATEMLYAIGAGSQVKAVDKYSDYPSGVPRTNLDGLQLNVEAITAYKPHLVITQSPSAADKKLRALGIPVLNEPAAKTLDQAYKQILELGDATGHRAEASAETARIKTEVSNIVKKAAQLPVRPATYYYELDPTYYSQTSSTFIGELLKLLGLRSIADSAQGAAASNGSPQLSGEFILKADPDHIFLADTLCCEQSANTLKSRPGWSSLAAVRQGRVLELNDSVASRWGPRIVTLLQTVLDHLKAHPATSSP